MKKLSRNDPCHCGSGKKYKQCCLPADDVKKSESIANAADQVAAKLFVSTTLTRALADHQNGRLAEAASGYQQILSRDPHHFDALHLLGVVAQQTGDHERSIQLITQALSIQSNSPYAFNNLGSAYLAVGRSAKECFANAIALKPDYAEAHNNLGNAYKLEGKFDDALNSYHRAIDIQPSYAEVHNNLSIVYQKLRRLDAALDHAKLAVTYKGDSAEIFNNLGNVYKDRGDIALALSYYHLAVKIEPHHGNALHFIAALSGCTSTVAPAAYVASIFNDYAERFDHHLQQVLDYKIPEILAERMRSIFTLPLGSLRILDLGCGTGLVGATLASHARELVGVDLSSNMLGKARARNLYHRLEQSDLLSMIRKESGGSYDVVVAADVFVYVGQLDDIVEEVGRLLRSTGLFAYSVESLDDSPESAERDQSDVGYLLRPSGRYAHSKKYLTDLGAMHGFRSIELTPQTIRTENGQAIPGWLVIWQK